VRRLALMLALLLLFVMVLPGSVPPGAATVSVRPGAGGPPSLLAEARPAVAPCIGQLGQATLFYNYSHAPVYACFYPVGQVPLGGGNVCALTWELPVPEGATQVSLLNLPVGMWTFEAAGPGNLSAVGNSVIFVNYATVPTEAASVFFLQMVGPCYEDPYLASIGSAVANLTARVAALSSEVATLLSALDGLNVTTQARIAGTQFLVSEALAEENATYSYRLIGGTPTRTGNTFTFPVFVELMNGGVANASLTGQVCRGLSVTFVNATETSALNWTPAGCGSGRLSITVPLTEAQAAETSTGSAILTLTAPVQSGTFTNLAGGVLSSQQVSAATSSTGWWSTVFGISTPPPSQNLSSIGGVVADLAWWGDSTAGRATYAATTILAVLIYLREAHRMTRERMAGQRTPPKGATSP
jgi:hypothetical protein